MLISFGLTTDWDETPSEHPICTPHSEVLQAGQGAAVCGHLWTDAEDTTAESLLDTGLGALTPKRLPYKIHHGLSPSPYIQAGCPVGP